MTSKPANSSNSRLSGKFIEGAKKFSSTLSDQAVIDAGVGIFIIVLLSMLLLRNYQRPQVDPLPIGEVAQTDIIAPHDLKVEDAEETSRRRALAVQGVFPVYDYNPRVMRDVRNSIEKMFKIGRETDSAVPPEELRQTIEEQTGIIVDHEQLDTLQRHYFNKELERLMVDQIESVMVLGVVDRRSQLVRVAPNGIHRRDVKTQEESVITDISSIHDLITARAALRSDKLLLPVDYNASERKQIGEILGSIIISNMAYNEDDTEARKNESRNSVIPVTVSVEKGQPIVVTGETVTEPKAALLKAAAAYRPIGQRAIEFAGTVVIVMMLVLVLWQYLLRYQHRHLRVRRHFLLQIACFVITLGLARLFFALGDAMTEWARAPFNSQIAYQYLAPLAVGAALITLLTDAHAAFVFSAILTVFVGMLSGNVYLAAYTLMSSVGAIYHLQNCRDRTAMVRAGLWIGMVNAAAALALDLLGANQPDIWLMLFDTFCGFASGVIAAMVASITLPLFEWLFEITTSIKLLELSNLNLPLLRQLAERAPGTYHHSIMVGMLAEAGVEAIGGDALFARVACYYHDIGKAVRPQYFIENQMSGENRHDRLNPKMSSIVLINHVKQGIEIARQHKLPPRIISMIPQHHGTGLMKYFYYKARNADDGSDPSALEQEFRYPGPKPQTREAAVIMIADSVEAAARTIQEPTPTKLRNMIEMIITRIRDDGQFDECDITLRDLKLVVDSFVKVLLGIHHHRISYPGYDFDRGAGRSASQKEPTKLAATTPMIDSPATVIVSAESQSIESRETRGD